MPGDNSCLFHTVRHGLKKLGRAMLPCEMFRAAVTVWMMAHPTTRIGTSELAEWVRWEVMGRVRFPDYCTQMGKPRGQWGGTPEIASMATKEEVNIWVWTPCEHRAGYFVRGAIFEGGDGSARIDICRVRMSHYEYLEIDDAVLNAQLLSTSQAASLGAGPSTPARGAADADAECPPTVPPPATVPPPLCTTRHFAPSPPHAPPAVRRCAGDCHQVHVRRFHGLAELERRELGV